MGIKKNDAYNHLIKSQGKKQFKWTPQFSYEKFTAFSDKFINKTKPDTVI